VFLFCARNFSQNLFQMKDIQTLKMKDIINKFLIDVKPSRDQHQSVREQQVVFEIQVVSRQK
jgi:hypothetical protein